MKARSSEERIHSATSGGGVARSAQGGAFKNGTPLNCLRVGAGNGIRTRDFDLGKVALYH